MTLEIRPFRYTDSEYETLGKLELAVWPDTHMTAAVIKHYDSTHDQRFAFERFMAMLDKKPVAYGYYREPPGSYRPGKYQIGVYVHPDFERRGLGTAVYDTIFSLLQKREPAPAILMAYSQENKPQAVRFLQKRGFELVMRWVVSLLDVAAWEIGRFAGKREQLEAGGIQIQPLAALQSAYPDWQQQLYDLEWDAILVEPSPDEPTQIPFEAYVDDQLSGPNFWPQGWFVAVDEANGRFVGLTQLHKNGNNPANLQWGFTAVYHTHRRRGVATVLKAAAIEFAQKQGYQTIRTNNEEDNPMLQINYTAGFRPYTATLAFKKTILRP